MVFPIVENVETEEICILVLKEETVNANGIGEGVAEVTVVGTIGLDEVIRVKILVVDVG